MNMARVCELDELFLNLLAHAFVLLFFLGKLFLLFCDNSLVVRLLFSLLHSFRLVDDGFDVLIQISEPLDAHQGVHRFLVVH